MDSTILKTTIRDGNIALWINDMNVWDLATKEFTIDVESAILRAYELGKRDAFTELDRSIDCNFNVGTRFPRPKEG